MAEVHQRFQSKYSERSTKRAEKAFKSFPTPSWPRKRLITAYFAPIPRLARMALRLHCGWRIFLVRARIYESAYRLTLSSRQTHLMAERQKAEKSRLTPLTIDTSSLFIFRLPVGRAYLQSGFPSPLPLDICSFDYCAQLNIKRDLCPRRLRSFFMFIQ